MCLSPTWPPPSPSPSRFSTFPPPQELLGDLFIHPNMLAQEEMLGEGAYATVHKARCGTACMTDMLTWVLLGKGSV